MTINTVARTDLQIPGGDMTIDWIQIQKVMFPVKDFETLIHRLKEPLDFPCIRETYNFPLDQMAGYTQKLLGGDGRNRYENYTRSLVKTFSEFSTCGIQDVVELVSQSGTREQFEKFSLKTNISGKDIITSLTYMAYWFIPSRKLLNSLVRGEPAILEAALQLRETGIWSNLELLQQGRTPSMRMEIAKTSRLPEASVSELVHRADFSRMPWASKATISNIIGAGYGSLEMLASADPEQLQQDFFQYGKSIGKNLKFGNEIESSYRIAKILPVLLRNDP